MNHATCTHSQSSRAIKACETANSAENQAMVAAHQKREEKAYWAALERSEEAKAEANLQSVIRRHADAQGFSTFVPSSRHIIIDGETFTNQQAAEFFDVYLPR